MIGKQAHPEELVQYLGRLRKTTVPCFMVIHTGIDENHQVNIDTLKTTYLDKNAKFINRLNKVAELLREIFDDLMLFIAEDILYHFSNFPNLKTVFSTGFYLI